MRKLDSITLSNLRKFGPDVTIEFSPGATILLAPNGTGKTTVFEAIEFGLTGKIARLSDDLSPVIRDNEAAASVSLNFNDFTASSLVTSAGKVSQDGDLSAIFPGISETDIPFLLRITHLLDQRENEWIVKAEEKDAGAKLARLPIGRDGSKASAMLPAVRRALNEKKTGVESSLANLLVELNEWSGLIQERNLATVGLTGALRSREDICNDIIDVATQTDSHDQIPLGLLTKSVSQDFLTIAHSSLHKILETNIDRVREQISGLNAADGIVETFQTTKNKLEQLTQELKNARQAYDVITKNRAENAALLHEHQVQIHQHQQQSIAVVQELEGLVGESTTKQQIQDLNQALTEATAAVQIAEENCNVLREQYANNQKVLNQHTEFDAQLQALSKSEQNLLSSQRLVTEWETAEEQLRVTILEIDRFQKDIDNLNVKLIDKQLAHETCKVAETTARTHFQVLSSSTDAIRQAVAAIAENLPADQSNCPLCLEPHGSELLKARVAKALQAIDPSLTLAEQQLRNAAEAISVSENDVLLAKESLRASQTQLQLLETNRQKLERQISEFRISPLIANGSIVLAKESIKQQLEIIISNRQSLTEKKAAFPPPIPSDSFIQIKQAYDRAILALDATRLQQSDTLIRLEHAIANLTAITSGAQPSRTLEILSSEKNSLDQQIRDLNSKVETIKLELETQQQQLQELKVAYEQIEKDIKRAQLELTQLRVEWNRLNLIGDPLVELAQAQRTKLSSILATLDSFTLKLEIIGTEISAWSKLNESHLAQRLIDTQRLERSEEEHTAKLNEQIIAVRANLKWLTQLSEAMQTLDTSLKEEIGNVQKHVSKVVPRWQALLKRVVRDPRFHEASLKFFSAYNKERAGVSVPLSGKSVPVPNVASEAQLTDMQLTFLLSMAISHQWSPWKALLLDDPTQHHDLVHASAVFDVLRDYIVDHGFQIVIATHDSLQARYFLRKLQNDGIDAKIWNLVPTENGVSAEELYGKPRIS